MIGSPNAWITTPQAVWVPRSRWDNGTWKTIQFMRIRWHEAKHLERLRSRPKVSQWGWMLRMAASWRMRLEEEAVAFAEEVKGLAEPIAQSLMLIFALQLDHEYHLPCDLDEIRQALEKACGFAPREAK
jgi:hypothetical protein